MSMGSNNSPVQDLRAMLRLVRQVQHLPPRREVRKQFVVCSLRGMLGARTGLALEIENLMPGCAADTQEVVIESDRTARKQAKTPPLQEDLLTEPLSASLFDNLRYDGVSTFLRSDLVSDRTWHGCDRFKQLHKSAGIGDFIWSLRPAGPPGAFHALAFYGDAKVMPFSDRERSVVHAIHSELDALYEPATSSAGDHIVQSLTPRESEVLALLLTGDSEKMIAYKIGISRNTIHDYIKTIYRQFNVASRPELMAQFIARNQMAN